MTLDEMIANGMDPNTEVEIPLTLEQIDFLIKSLEQEVKKDDGKKYEGILRQLKEQRK
mgnify:FL=1